MFLSRRRAFSVCAAPVLSAFAGPQEDTATDQFTLSTDVELVILDIAVRSPKCGNISGLAKENFHVFDNSRPQTIQNFTSADIPVTVGLVIDNSGSMGPKRADVITAGLTFAHASNPRDEIFVVLFNDKVARGLPDDVQFTDDNNLLRTALMSGKPEGRTALYDALAYGLQHLDQGRMAKKTLVVVSDGGDNVSAIRWPEVVRRVEESRATLYTIGMFTDEDRDRNPDVLRKLARISGGEYFQLNEPGEVVPVCRKIASDIRSRYTLSYIPHAPAANGGTHVIKVTASDPSRGRLLAHTRTHYRRLEKSAGKGSQ